MTRCLIQNYYSLHYNNLGGKSVTPRPGIEPGPSTWQAEILTTRLSRIVVGQRSRPQTDFSRPFCESTHESVCHIEKNGNNVNQVLPPHTMLHIFWKRKKWEKDTPSSRIWTSDLWITALIANYSPPLYQLSYRRSDEFFVYSQVHTVESCDLSSSLSLFRSGQAPVEQDFHMLTTAPRCFDVVQGA